MQLNNLAYACNKSLSQWGEQKQRAAVINVSILHQGISEISKSAVTISSKRDLGTLVDMLVHVLLYEAHTFKCTNFRPSRKNITESAILDK